MNAIQNIGYKRNNLMKSFHLLNEYVRQKNGFMNADELPSKLESARLWLEFQF